MEHQSIRMWALRSGINPRTAQRAVKRLGVGAAISNGKTILLTKKEWREVLKELKK